MEEKLKAKGGVLAYILPGMLLASLIAFVVLYQVLNLPRPEELVKIIEHYFALYGYPVLFFSALIEAIPVINLYFPGSSVILLAAAFSRTGTMNLAAVIIITSIAFMISFSFNYLMGKHGWYHIFIKCGLGSTLKTTSDQVEKHGGKWMWLSYIHPNIGALTSTSYGILRLPYRTFFLVTIIGVVFWDTFWAFVAYLSYSHIVEFIAFRWFFIGIIALYILYKIAVMIRKRRKA